MIAAAELASARVVLVEAPVGFGKTAVAERLLADDERLPVRVRPAGDPLTAVRRALRRAGAGFAADAEDLDGSAHFFATLLTRKIHSIQAFNTTSKDTE